jgi:excisionase family DNA binding protein
VATLESIETQEAAQSISVREAAELAGVSYVHIGLLIKRGEIDAVRVGNLSGPLRIDRRDLRAAEGRRVSWLVFVGGKAGASSARKRGLCSITSMTRSTGLGR